MTVTWDDYGCVADDGKFDNGPILSNIIADQQSRQIKLPPVGTLADYYVSSPIDWPPGHGGVMAGCGGYTYAVAARKVGLTRLVWNGPEGGEMIRYRGSGGRIAQLVLVGGPLKNPEFPTLAGVGILVEARNRPPSGKLITEQVAITQCDTGVRCLSEPDANHADHLTHYSLMFHRVRAPYRVECHQSVIHTFFNLDVRSCVPAGDLPARVFDFEHGGHLHVYGCYSGYSRDCTLLRVGRSTSNNANYEISGLAVDGSARRIRLVEHGRYAHRVRVSGAIGSSATTANPIVLDRRERMHLKQYHDVVCDVRGA